jgi:3-oxoacyl-[acyl-carrier protein] reductase
MIRARFGRVVNIASIVGPRANAGQANYAASKAGLIGLTKTVAVEVARRGVTVNAVAPGPTETEAFEAMSTGAQALKERLARVSPAGRMGRPEDVAPLIAWLCSEDAGWVTGQLIFSDGGYSLV